MNDSTYSDPYVSGYDTPVTTSSGDAAAALGVFMLFYFIVAIIAYVVNSIFLGMIFKKAGVEPWKAWVPIYNSWVMLEMGDQPGWWALLMLIPGVNIVGVVFLYIAMYKIGLKFGKEGVFILLAIFLPIVWLIWLAVDKSTWQGAQAASAPATPTTPAAM